MNRNNVWSKRLLTVVFAVLSSVLLVFGQSESANISSQEKETTPVALFESNSVLKISIYGDFADVMQDRGEDRSYHKGRIIYIDHNGDSISRKIKVKARGNFRRSPDNCKYPPIKVKFGKLKTADSIFQVQKKLKLVTQCQLEDYVLLEYLAYRFYNTLTDDSYRVRLAHITYGDLETKTSYFTRYAFFIEDEKEMATRIGADVYKPNVTQYLLDRNQIVTAAFFQYMIGNDDWFATSKHNMSILEMQDDGALVAIPYDFDWSEFVDATYTKPEGVPGYQLSKRQVYKGLCLDEEEFLAQKALFEGKKEVFINMIKELEDLPKGRMNKAVAHINQFYRVLNRANSLEKIFQAEKCIQVPAQLPQ